MRNPPEHPFSNGTEERAWMDVWCTECANDHGMHHDGVDAGCEILLDYLRASTGGLPYPSEWTDYSDEVGLFLPTSMVCSEFEQCTACDERPELDDEGRTHRTYAAHIRSLAKPETGGG